MICFLFSHFDIDIRHQRHRNVIKITVLQFSPEVAGSPIAPILDAVFEKTCATTQKYVKSHVFLKFEKKRKNT